MIEPLKNNLSGLPKSLKEVGAKLLTENVRRHALVSSVVLFSSYVLASAASSFTIPLMMKSISNQSGKGGRKADVQIQTSLKSEARPNFHKVKRSVLDRNVFNQSGEFPEEEEEVVEQTTKTSGEFDMAGPCTPTTLKITLVGTLFFGDRTQSMATIKEAGFEVDIYREGDAIIGQEGAYVVSIERNRVVINNSGSKECLAIDLGGEDRLFVEHGKTLKKKSSDSVESAGETVILSSAFVESELGDGFGKIIQSARLVPNMVDQRVNGFKIFAIKKDSLLDKVGFKNGDVITQVNETVMEAEHGFALYQALLDERDLSIRVLRNGKTPTTLSVRIK